MLSSKDDWYTMSSGLVALETTNSIYNHSLYAQVKPEVSHSLAFKRELSAELISASGLPTMLATSNACQCVGKTWSGMG